MRINTSSTKSGAVSMVFNIAYSGLITVPSSEWKWLTVCWTGTRNHWADNAEQSSVPEVQFSSIPQLHLTRCNPMDCSMPGFPVHHQLLEFTQTQRPLSRWCHPTISSSVIPFSFHLQSFPASGSFPVSQFFASGGQSVGVSALASVLPMNIQDWFPLGWTGWIALQSKGLSRGFSNTTVQKHQFFGAQLSL